MRTCRVRILQKLESCRDELKKHDKVKHSLIPCLPPPPTKKRGIPIPEHRKGTMCSQAVHVVKNQGLSQK